MRGSQRHAGDGHAVQGGVDEILRDAPVCTTSFALVQVVEPGGSGLARVGRLTMQPIVEMLTQDILGTPGVPSGGPPVTVNALLDTWSGVTFMSVTLERQLQQEAHRSVNESL